MSLLSSARVPFPFLLTPLLALPSASAQSTIQLPTQLPGAEALDMNINPVPRGLTDMLRTEGGMECQNFQTFSYSNGAQTSTALNSWLAQQGLTARTFRNESTEIAWTAVRGDNTGVAAYYQGSDVDSPSGLLYLCTGLATTQANTAQAAPAQPGTQQTAAATTTVTTANTSASDEETEYTSPREERRNLRRLLPIGLLLGTLLGAGLAWFTKVYMAQQAKLDEESAARWNSDDWDKQR